VGPLTATALVAAVGNASEFGRGRDLAAWFGLVLRQHGTDRVPRLLGISSRGNTDLRWLFGHGGRSVREHLECEQHAGGRWITALETRMHPKKVTVAVTAKRVRVCWVILRRGAGSGALRCTDAGRWVSMSDPDHFVRHTRSAILSLQMWHMDGAYSQRYDRRDGPIGRPDRMIVAGLGRRRTRQAGRCDRADPGLPLRTPCTARSTCPGVHRPRRAPVSPP